MSSNRAAEKQNRIFGDASAYKHGTPPGFETGTSTSVQGAERPHSKSWLTLPALLMSPQQQPMVHTLGLMIFQRRQFGEGRGLGLVQDGFGDRLQGAPARPFEVRRVSNLPEKAAPFDDRTVDVAGTEQVGNPDMFAERVLVDRGNDLLGASPIFWRHPIFQVAGNRLKAELVMTNEREAATATVAFTTETKSGI